jgi:hypothetical protein
MYTLAKPKQAAWNKKRMKKGNFSMEQKFMGDLTETPSHAWLRAHPNT